MRPVLLSLSALALALVLSPANLQSRAGQALFDLRVAPLASPAAASSGEPQLSVSSRGILLSWIERDGQTASLKAAERTAGGWSAPVTVAAGDDWFVNWADVPSVLRLSDGTLVAHWLQKSGPGTYAYDVRLTYSGDEGRTWAESFTPHHDGTETEHGFASLFEMPGGGLGLVWLDGRQMAGEAGAGGDHAGAPGAMSLRFAAYDASWTQTADTALDARVCECCPTTAAVTADGPIAAFRDRSEDEIRDIYVARVADGGWTTGRPVHEDNWQINACPVNGPTLAADGSRVALAWFHAKERTGATFVAFSDDAGRTFGAPVRVDDGATLGRVDLELLADGSALVSWIERTEDGAEFRARRVTHSGERSAPVTVAPLASSRASGYPRMARHGDELVFAWTDAGAPRSGQSPQVRTAVATVPTVGR